MLVKNKVPLYYQLAEIIIHDIESKNLKENDKLMTEKEYCDKYNISRATVRQEIGYLENRGYIYKIQGSGTFVSSRRVKQKLLKFYSFTDEMKKQGKTPKSEILDFSIVEASEKIQEELKLEQGEKVYEIVRLRYADNEKMMYERTYLPEKKFPNLNKKDLLNNSLYGILQSRYNIIFSKAIERFSLEKGDLKICRKLSVEKGTPFIKLERWTYSGLDIIEYTISSVKGDKFEFEVELYEDKH